MVFQSGERTLGLLIDGLADIVEDSASMSQASGRRGLLGSAIIGQRFTDLLDLETVLRVGWAEWIGGSTSAAQVELSCLAAAIDSKSRSSELSRRKSDSMASANRTIDSPAALRYATFVVAGHYFGTDVTQVQEVLRHQAMTPVPWLHPSSEVSSICAARLSRP